MSALLRYLYLKSFRERFLIGLLLAPAVMMLAPVLALTIFEAIKPGAVPSAGSVRMLASVLGEVSVYIGVIVAGVGSFWVLRQEIANRQVGLFLLAARPSRVIAAVVTFGATTGFLSFWIAELAMMAVLGAAPKHIAPMVAINAVGCAVAAAIGAASVSFSPELPMLVPLYLVSLSVAAVLGKYPAHAFAGAAITFIVAAVAAPYLLSRRCAA